MRDAALQHCRLLVVYQLVVLVFTSQSVMPFALPTGSLL